MKKTFSIAACRVLTRRPGAETKRTMDTRGDFLLTLVRARWRTDVLPASLGRNYKITCSSVNPLLGKFMRWFMLVVIVLHLTFAPISSSWQSRFRTDDFWPSWDWHFFSLHIQNSRVLSFVRSMDIQWKSICRTSWQNVANTPWALCKTGKLAFLLNKKKLILPPPKAHLQSRFLHRVWSVQRWCWPLFCNWIQPYFLLDFIYSFFPKV